MVRPKKKPCGESYPVIRLEVDVGAFGQFEVDELKVCRVVAGPFPAPPSGRPRPRRFVPVACRRRRLFQRPLAGQGVKHLQDVLPQVLHLLGVDVGRALQEQGRLSKVQLFGGDTERLRTVILYKRGPLMQTAGHPFTLLL